MKTKLLILLLILTSLFCFLEWGTNQRSFLWQAEAEVLSKLFRDPMSAAHPFTLIPLLGQVLLLIALLQKKPSRLLLIVGISCLALLIGFIFLIGVMGGNLKMILSAIPFLGVALWRVVYKR